MSQTGDLLVTYLFFSGEVSSRVCSGALACCIGMAQRREQHTLWCNKLEDNNIHFERLCDHYVTALVIHHVCVAMMKDVVDDIAHDHNT
eukprot:5620686-Heterocapsa_arctica.AAC.1